MYLVERFNKRFLSGKIIGAFENRQNDFRENESASQSLKKKTILEKKTGMLFCIRRPVAALRPPFNTTCSF
jgi:hypothetical protein